MFWGKTTVEPTLIGGDRGGEIEGRVRNTVHARAKRDQIFQVIFTLSYLQSRTARIVLIN